MKKYFALLSVCAVVACVDVEELSIERDPETENPGNEAAVHTRAGADSSSQNPYSLSNVQQAYNDKAGELGFIPTILSPTHKYVRFAVKDSTDFYILHDSLNLELIWYPLDRELTEDEIIEYATDTSDPNNWHYTAVPAGFVFPSEVEYEFLDQIYMQAENEISTRNGTGPQLDADLYDLVIERSMLNNGIGVAPQIRGAAWYPSATVQFQDDYDRNENGSPDNVIIPLEGVKVRCTNFINVGSGTTDENGNVTGIKGWGGRFRNPVGYHIIWENKKWNIRDGRTGQAKTHGPKQRGHWDKTILTSDTKHSFFAAVHRALWAYFYETFALTDGITKARVDKMDTGVLWDKDHPKRVARFDPTKRTFGGNLILVYGKSNGITRDRWRATGSTFHELGHATHWQAVIDKKGANRIDDYHFADDILTESWARGVQSSYMRAFYTGYLQGSYFGNYTAVVESMMNQGMTLEQIENTMVGESRWNG